MANSSEFSTGSGTGETGAAPDNIFAGRRYPAFESLLLSDRGDALLDQVQKTCGDLDQIQKTGSALEKGRATAAIAAYGRTLDLMQKIREEMQRVSAESEGR
jgi:hypothetical protein